jgi:hypothetical protein
MAMKKEKDDFDLDALLHPASAFAHPMDVVRDPDLTLNAGVCNQRWQTIRSKARRMDIPTYWGGALQTANTALAYFISLGRSDDRMLMGLPIPTVDASQA